MRTRALSAALACCAAASACGGDATGPTGARLTEADAAAVARAVLATGVSVAGDGAAGAPSAARRSLSDGGNGSFAFPISGTEPCRPTGSVSLSGTVSGSWSEAEQTASVRSDLSLRHRDCAIPTGDGGIVVIDGEPSIDVALEATGGAAGLASLRLTQRGTFDWEKDGGSGRCTLDLTAELAAGGDEVRVSGTFCGFAVDLATPLAG